MQITRVEPIEKITNELGLRSPQPGTSPPVYDVDHKVTPVYEIGAKFATITRDQVCTNATTATITTLPTDRDFYLTSAMCSYIKDVTSTATNCGLNVYPAGENQVRNIINFATLTLTVGQDSCVLNLTHPLKLKRGTVIGLFSSTNVANITLRGSIMGYYMP